MTVKEIEPVLVVFPSTGFFFFSVPPKAARRLHIVEVGKKTYWRLRAETINL
jgi:hypothetical protein